MANNKVIFGDNTLIDLTEDTVDAAHLMSGYTAHDASGNLIVGTAVPGSGSLTYVVALSTTALRNCPIDVLDEEGSIITSAVFNDNGKAQVSLPSTGIYTFRVTYTAAINVTSNRTIVNNPVSAINSLGDTSDTTSFDLSGTAGLNVDDLDTYDVETTY